MKTTIELVHSPSGICRELGSFDYAQLTFKTLTAAKDGSDAEELATYTGGGAEDEGGVWKLHADGSEWTDIIVGSV